MLIRAVLFATLFTTALLPQQQPRPLPASSPAIHLQPLPDEALHMKARLERNLTPSARAKVQTAASSLSERAKQSPTMPTVELQANAHEAALQAFPNAKAMDLEALTYAVLMESTNAAEADLQQAMRQMEEIDSKKASLRSQIAASGKGTQQTGLTAVQKNLQGQLDSMNEMSETISMRLQMAMDRRSKFVEALSNVMKKIDSTQETIVQNIK